MKVTYDRHTDTLTIELRSSAVAGNEEPACGVILDYDAERRVTGLEILDVSRRARERDNPSGQKGEP